MNLCNKAITIAKLNCMPVLIYAKEGNVLKTYGVDDHHCMFSTFYYLPVKETINCYIFRRLVPIKFCEQVFFKQTETTITVNKDCILGTHLLYNGTITNTVIIHQSFDDCIIGDYTIAKGFKETVIWQSNTKNYTGKAQLEYTHGDDTSLEVNVESIDGRRENYQLSRYDSMTIKLRDVQSLKIAKEYRDSKASGRYSIEVYGEITRQIKL